MCWIAMCTWMIGLSILEFGFYTGWLSFWPFLFLHSSWQIRRLKGLRKMLTWLASKRTSMVGYQNRNSGKVGSNLKVCLAERYQSIKVLEIVAHWPMSLPCTDEGQTILLNLGLVHSGLVRCDMVTGGFEYFELTNQLGSVWEYIGYV